MEKYIYNEQNGLWYELQGDYYIPCLVLDEEDTQPIGMWGRKHLRYIKEHRRARYTTLLISGKLNNHLVEIDNRAAEMFERLMKQLAEKEGSEVVAISAKIEEELSDLPKEEKEEFLKELEIERSGLDELIAKVQSRDNTVGILLSDRKLHDDLVKTVHSADSLFRVILHDGLDVNVDFF